ncbi:DNA ligase (NAD(+)) LigA [Treponema phagedenis]|uniref:DNA ligase n=1 Tax=Treponema phagedenis TaxID=162 RepID=A0A0B7GSA1_TREPH|nr:NAD-dependent DNA ligase LigA [Treponema phagedenis]QSI00428.1 DNA ligase (NAD(+)) LigA [Treponema phagedenis]CEM61484.1 DNA ligase [Treponema phagedenis]
MKRNPRAVELEKLIRYHQDLYYNKEAEIPDSEFDALWDELRALEPENELFFTVPKESSDGFPKASHIIPMGSQEKAANPEAFTAWALKMPFTQFLVQYKLDGASLELQYERGRFVRAVTRGDGKIGDDITANVRKMQGVVSELQGESAPAGAQPFSGGIRGEVLMTKEIHKKFYADKANCRNAANGLMKRKDGSGSEHLLVICYDAVQGSPEKPFTGTAPFSTELEKLAWLKRNGFSTVEIQVCNSIQEVIDWRAHVMDIRESLPYDIDGLVIKNNLIDPDDVSRPRPEKQIAFKFSLEEAITTLREVEWSESGATYTPIAITDPVRLAGTTVKRANLANPNMITDMNLKIGSKVVITKRGEIIPKIETLVENTDECTEIPMPTVCGTCGSSLLNEGTRLFCPNAACPKLIHHRIEKWIATLDIRDFGINLIQRLFDSNKVNSIVDLYTLTVEDLASIERMGEISAKKVHSALHAKKEISLETFIAGFDIDGIGVTMVEKLTQAGFNTLDKLFEADEQKFSTVYQFGEVLAQNLVRGLQTLKAEMTALIEKGFITIKPPAAPDENAPLHGMSFCFTGELTAMNRSEAEQLVKEKGGSVKSSVTKGLSYLVTNTPESGSAKNKKAQQLGTAIITEEAFFAFLQKEHKTE